MAEGGGVKFNALVIGGTGATGKQIVGYLLKHKDKVDKVTVLGRRKLEFTEELTERYGTSTSSEEESGRLVQHVEDLDTVSEETVKNLCTGTDVFFCCIGKGFTFSSQLYFQVDCEIPDRIARFAAASGVKHASLLTGRGANVRSWFQFLRTKGEVEERFKAAGFKSVSVFRPGVLERGSDSRFTEKVAKIIFPYLRVEDLAKAMVQDAFDALSTPRGDSGSTQSTTFEVADIKEVYEKSEL